MNEVDIRKMSTDRELHVVTHKVFLRELDAGVNISLLSYRDHIKIRYFIQEKNDSIPQELYFIKYYASGPGNKMLTMKSYVGQLATIASKYVEVTSELQREIETAAYKSEPLQRIVSRINGKSDREIRLELEQKNKYRFYAGIALNRTVIQFKGESSFTAAEHNPASYLPRLAFGADAFINRNTQRLLLRMEGSLASSNHYIETSDESQYTLHYYSYEIAQHTVSLSPQVIYNLYNKDSFKFYVGGGFSLNYSIYSTNRNNYEYDYINPSTGATRKEIAMGSFKLEPVWASYILRTGIVLRNKYEASAVFHGPAPVTRYVGFGVEHQAFSLGVNYLFSK